MKNLTSIVIAIVVAFSGSYAAFVGINRLASPEDSDVSVGGGVTQGQRYYITAGTGLSTHAGDPSASTTKVYLQSTATGAASSTITGVMERADSIDLNIRAIASSSAANLVFVREFSDNKYDWYAFDEATTTVANAIPIGHDSTNILHSWNLSTTTQLPCGGGYSQPSATSTEVCKHIELKGGYAKYFRIKFWVTGANASVWAYAVPRESVPN